MTIRIGTRESELAMWQANTTAYLLNEQGYSTEIVPIKSEGDADLTTPLYKMGVTGVFTRMLDIALLQNRIDVAVHSMKDVPTDLPEGIVEAAVLERGNFADLFVPNPAKFQEAKRDTQTEEELMNALLSAEDEKFPFIQATVATGSIRRRAQWLHRFPNHTIDGLRGNVITRMGKLENSAWNGAIFAAAGLERISRRPAEAIELKWMLPAPAQGAIMVACRQGDEEILDACRKINHAASGICANLERSFLSALLGGCSTPISAHAVMEDDNIIFRGNIVSPDGKLKAEVKDTCPVAEVAGFGKRMAEIVRTNGGAEIIASLGKK